MISYGNNELEMAQLIDFQLHETRYDKLIECLENHCELSDDFFENNL